MRATNHPGKPARVAKTIKAIASVDGRMRFGMVKFQMMLGTDGVWRSKVTYLGEAGDKTTAWTVCESPLPALGLDPSQIVGDVSFWLPESNERTLNGSLVTEVFVTGDIGHRVRLPRVTKSKASRLA